MKNDFLILHETSRYHHWQGKGNLSIKSFERGHAHYLVERSPIRVDAHCYLVLNEGQEYTVTVDAPTPVESFCLFFPAGFAERVHYARSCSAAALLEDPVSVSGHSLSFYERTYPHDHLLSPLLTQLRIAHRHVALEAPWLEEQMHCVMERLLLVHGHSQIEVAQLPAKGAATRDELYRRVYRARDYLLATLDENLTLTELAEVAMLSPNHFLRSFKAIFHQSPHQYRITERLERAKRLLAHSSLSVTEIALQVGFESPTTFSWRFRRTVGCSPRQFRQAKKAD